MIANIYPSIIVLAVLSLILTLSLSSSSCSPSADLPEDSDEGIYHDVLAAMLDMYTHTLPPSVQVRGLTLKSESVWCALVAVVALCLCGALGQRSRVVRVGQWF